MCVKLKLTEFIKKSKKTHNIKYDYSLVEYKNNTTKIKILCPIHGEFKQIPKSHILGADCPECGKLKRRKSISSNFTKKDFIKKSILKHTDRYDYSNVKYINSHRKVKIICLIHGEFDQTPNSHINGNGCPYCVNNTKHTTLDFIKRSNKIHNDEYNYDMVIYKDNSTKVKIICPIHGIFKQIPKNHLMGRRNVSRQHLRMS